MRLPAAVRWHIKFREAKSKSEAEYIIQVINLFQKRLKEKFSSILDVACGNGRLHPFLRRAGFDVTGIDNSKELIEEVKKSFPKFKDFYHLGDMRNFNLNKKFDVVLSWFTSFGYFESDRVNLKVLKNIAKHLRKNGIFLLDIPNAPIAAERIVSNPNIIQYADNFVEICNQRIETRKVTLWVLKQNFYIKRGRDLKFVKTEMKKVRIYSIPEITKMLKSAGLKTLKIFNSGTFEKVTEHDKQMLIVSRKL
jgi:SAM-dependent methyltransferase